VTRDKIPVPVHFFLSAASGPRYLDAFRVEEGAMRARLWIQAVLASGLLAAAAPAAMAYTLSVEWTDPAGDGGPVGDATFVRLSFDTSGAWTAYWRADPSHPFTGNARFNLNLFDAALGVAADAAAPQVSLDGFRNFGASPAIEFSYSGLTPFLANWHVGDTVFAGNGSNFLSGVVNMDAPYGRDNLWSSGIVTAAVPEPTKYGLLLAGLGVLVVMARRR
jgi:hypothetical protein